MSWNYRILERQFDDGEKGYGFHEVYYNSKGEITSVSEEPIAPFGTTMDELRGDFQLMKEALHHPVLIQNELVFAEPDDQVERLRDHMKGAH